jgi:hypothetical protein
MRAHAQLARDVVWLSEAAERSLTSGGATVYLAHERAVEAA